MITSTVFERSAIGFIAYACERLAHALEEIDELRKRPTNADLTALRAAYDAIKAERDTAVKTADAIDANYQRLVAVTESETAALKRRIEELSQRAPTDEENLVAHGWRRGGGGRWEHRSVRKKLCRKKEALKLTRERGLT